MSLSPSPEDKKEKIHFLLVDLDHPEIVLLPQVRDSLGTVLVVGYNDGLPVSEQDDLDVLLHYTVKESQELVLTLTENPREEIVLQEQRKKKDMIYEKHNRNHHNRLSSPARIQPKKSFHSRKK